MRAILTMNQQQQQKIVNECDQEMSQSYTTDHHIAQNREAEEANNDNTYTTLSRQEN